MREQKFNFLYPFNFPFFRLNFKIKVQFFIANARYTIFMENISKICKQIIIKISRIAIRRKFISIDVAFAHTDINSSFAFVKFVRIFWKYFVSEIEVSVFCIRALISKANVITKEI